MFFFVYVQLVIGGRGHVTQHMREFITVDNQSNNNFRKAKQIQSVLNQRAFELHTLPL